MKLWEVEITYKTVIGEKTSSLTFEGENKESALKEAQEFFAKELPSLEIVRMKISQAPYR